MKFTLEGIEYWIEFRYKKMDGLRAVECRIFKPEDRDDRNKTFSWGWSQCAKADQFKKDTGRKVALTRAAMKLPKPARKIIWAAYLGRKKAA